MSTKRALALFLVAAIPACGADGRKNPVTGDMAGQPNNNDMSANGSSDLANGGCATASYEAHQAPAAMLVVLDRSASMADGNKWVFAAQAVVQALDQDVFDTMEVGLMTVPSGPVNAPQCVLDASFGTVTQVACGVPPFPQVDLKLAGNMKSNDAGGVRHDIKSYITQTMPEVNDPDSTPMYSGIQAALADLQAIPNMKRILMVVSDGSWDCAVFGNRGGFDDCNCCSHEWEDPQNVIKLVGDANKDPNAPVETFIVGVPGADTVGVQGQGGCGDMVGCDWPPYAMRAALSAIAFSGSPTNVPANCTGKTFTQATPNPQTSCHFDMTQGNFNTMALTTAISQVRGKVLGCTFDLPALDGGMVDPTQVNVDYSINGGMQMDLVKRADPNNPCTQMGCWDYTDANQNKIQLIGKACDDIQNNMNTKVDIVLGCATVIG